MSADDHDLGGLQLEENPVAGPEPEHAFRGALTDALAAIDSALKKDENDGGPVVVSTPVFDTNGGQGWVGLCAMPAAASRSETDVLETDSSSSEGPDHSQDLPSQPTDTEEPPKPLKNGKPRRWAENCVAASAVIYIGLNMLPRQLKKGQDWYIGAQSLALLSAAVSLASLFWRNTHIKMIRFLSGKKIFVQVAVLTLIDGLVVTMLPAPGWEASERIRATIGVLFRLAFICLDSLKGVSRWFRLLIALFFVLGNVWVIVSAYFLNPEQVLCVINATNTTVTTSYVRASVATTIVTLTTAMLVTIWQDKDFQYSALFHTYLPKLAVETAGAVPGSAEMDAILEEHAAAAVAWRNWPRKSAVVVLVSVVVHCVSVVISSTALATGDAGNESVMMVAIRVAALVLECSGACVFFYNNVSLRRLKYTFSSTQGFLWLFYTLIFAVSDLVLPDISKIWGDVLGTVYCSMGFIGWLSLESVLQISRVMHVTITFTTAFTLATVIYLTAYVWQDDVVLVDLNEVGVSGTLTRYAVQRTCLVNMLLLMAGSLVTVVKKNLRDNSYFVFVTGNVLRREILEVKSLRDDPDGNNDFVVQNSLSHRLGRHSNGTVASD